MRCHRARSAPAGAGDFLHQRRKYPKTPPVVGGDFTSRAAAHARRLARSVPPPLPTAPASLGCGGGPFCGPRSLLARCGVLLVAPGLHAITVRGRSSQQSRMPSAFRTRCRFAAAPRQLCKPLTPLAGGPTDSHAGDIGHRLGMTDGSARRFPFAKLTCHCEGTKCPRQSVFSGARSAPPENPRKGDIQRRKPPQRCPSLAVSRVGSQREGKSESPPFGGPFPPFWGRGQNGVALASAKPL